MFWRLRAPSKQPRAERLNTYERIKCVHNYRHQRGGKVLGELLVTFPKHNTADIVWTQFSDCLLSSKVLNILKERQLSGYTSTPLKVNDRKSKVAINSDWSLLIPTGWGGIASKKTGIRIKEYCPYCEHVEFCNLTNAKELVNLDAWDGSDFFMIWPLPRFIFVSEEAKHIMDGMQGAEFVKMEDLDYTGSLAPGKLSYYMPESRLRELPNLDDPTLFFDHV